MYSDIFSYRKNFFRTLWINIRARNMPQTEAEIKTFTRPTFLMYFDIFSYKKNFLRTLGINIRAKNTPQIEAE